MPKRKASVDTTTYEFTLSGTSYEAAGETNLPKPISSARRGYGMRHKFRADRKTLEAITDLLAGRACDLADDLGDDNPKIEQIYKDLDRFPEVVRPR